MAQDTINETLFQKFFRNPKNDINKEFVVNLYKEDTPYETDAALIDSEIAGLLQVEPDVLWDTTERDDYVVQPFMSPYDEFDHLEIVLTVPSPDGEDETEVHNSYKDFASFRKDFYDIFDTLWGDWKDPELD